MQHAACNSNNPVHAAPHAVPAVVCTTLCYDDTHGPCDMASEPIKSPRIDSSNYAVRRCAVSVLLAAAASPEWPTRLMVCC